MRHEAGSRRPLEVIAFVLLLAVACASSSGGGPGPNGSGVCTTSCPKSCSTDADCPSTDPECANFGSAGSACVPVGTSVPKFCTSDSACNTAAGEECCATNAASTDTVCALAAECRKSCSADTDCAGGTPKCCTDYASPVCTATDACPVACTQTTDCNTTAGQLCCTTIHLADTHSTLSPSLAGVCAPAAECPVSCTADSDCAGTSGQGELCCNGLCAATCVKSCTVDNDCNTENGQLCCNSPVLASPWYGFSPVLNVNPSGGGTECATLAKCCAGLQGSDAEECLAIEEQGNESSCESYLDSSLCGGVVLSGFDGGSSDCSTISCGNDSLCEVIDGTAQCVFVGEDAGGGGDSGFGIPDTGTTCTATCATDTDCVDSCPSDGNYCCDTSVGSCYASSSATCPDESDDAGSGVDASSCGSSGAECITNTDCCSLVCDASEGLCD